MEAEGAAHPRYRGPVVDVHCHYDASTREHAPAVNRIGGLEAAIHLWDVAWPPCDFAVDAGAWRELEPALLRCHVPDLSRVGAAGSSDALADGVRAAAAAGAVGVKVWKNLGLWLTDVRGRRLRLTDDRLEGLWAAAGAEGLPVMIHVGDPPAFFAPLDDGNPRIAELRIHPDWWYGDGDHPTLAELHEQLEALVAAHPSTRFVGVHFGCFMRTVDVRRMMEAYPNYYVDTAAALADMGGGDVCAVRDLIVDHADRVLFGTDLIRCTGYEMPDLGARRWDLAEFFRRHWRFFETADVGLEHPLPDQGDWQITGIDLPDSVLSLVYVENARRLFAGSGAEILAV